MHNRNAAMIPARTGPPARFVAAMFFAMMVLGLHAAELQVWETVRQSEVDAIGTGANDAGSKVLVSAAGEIVCIGTTDDRRQGERLLVRKWAGHAAAPLWEKVLAGPGPCSASEACLDSVGDIVIAGRESNERQESYFFLLKISGTDGSLLWRHNGPKLPWRREAGRPLLSVDSRGNAILAVAADGSESGVSLRLAKHQGSDGALLWETSTANFYEIPQAMTCDAVDNIIITSDSDPGNSGNHDFLTAKHDGATGVRLWSRIYDGPGGSHDIPAAVAVNTEGDVIVAGTSAIAPAWASGFYVAKYKGDDGSLTWEWVRSPAGLARDTVICAVLGSDGSVFVGGYENPLAPANQRPVLARLDGGGSLLWEQHGEGIWSENAGLTVDGEGNITTAMTVDGKPKVARLAQDTGATLWQWQWPEQGWTASVALDAAGNTAVLINVGLDQWEWPRSSGADIVLARLAAADGNAVWQDRYDGSAHAWEEIADGCLDAQGSLVFAGASLHGSTGFDFYAGKMNPATGQVLWQHRYNGGAGLADAASAVAVDALDHVFVAGKVVKTPVVETEEGPIGGTADMRIAKLGAAGGSVLWEKSYDGAAGLADEATGIAVDSSGNALVAGWTEREPGKADIYAAKYAAEDGAVIWERLVGKNAGTDWRAWSCAVDVSGDLVLTGLATRQAAGKEVYTMKLAGSDGAIIWEGSHDGGENARPLALRLTAAGDAVVLAQSNDEELAVIQYHGNSGQLAWRNVITGIKKSQPLAAALDVTPAGDVVVSVRMKDFFTSTILYASADGQTLWQRPSAAMRERDEIVSDPEPHTLLVAGQDRYFLFGKTECNNGELTLALSTHALSDGANMGMRAIGASTIYEEEFGLGRPIGAAILASPTGGELTLAVSRMSAGLWSDFSPAVSQWRTQPDSPHPLTLDALQGAKPDGAFYEWTLSGRAHPDQIYAIESSNGLQWWGHSGLVRADAQGVISMTSWTNVPQFFWRFVWLR